MSAMKQIISVVGMNTRALPTRLAASLVVVIGMAAVVAVSLSIFSMSAGLFKMMEQGSSPDRMIVLSQGAADEGSSSISRDTAAFVAETPGIKKDSDGRPLVTGRLMSNYITRNKGTGVQASVLVSGVGPNMLAIHPDIKLIEGRMFTPGRREVVAGKTALIQFENIAMGGQIILQDGPWDVVGIVDAHGPADYQLYTDGETLMAALRRNAFTSMTVKLEDSRASTIDKFAAALKSNPALSVDVKTEEAYAAGIMKPLTSLYTALAYGVGAIMGLGAVFAALNTMYAAVTARLIEIATLRAIGFGATSVVISIIVEGLGLAIAGAAVGGFIAWAAFNGHAQDLGPVAVALAVTPRMLATGIGLSLIVGTIGALFPAIRAARLPVATALQVR